MQGDAPVSWIMFFTLAAGVFIIAGLFIRFLHSHRNREIAANALAGDNSPRVGATPNGALPDLVGACVCPDRDGPAGLWLQPQVIHRESTDASAGRGW